LRLLIFIFGLLLISGCDIRDNEVKPLESWTRIYDTESLDDSFYPEALAQTDTGDFVIVFRYRNDESTFPATGVMSADKDGIFNWFSKVDLPEVNPTWPMFEKEGAFHIMGMDEITLAPTVLQVDLANQTLSRVAEVNGVVFPLSMADVGVGYVLQAYAPDDLATQLLFLDNQFQPVWEEKFSVLEDAEQRIISHLTAIQGNYPFFCGTTADRYFFNGFTNFTLSMVFVPKGGGSETGLIQGFQDDSGVANAQVLQSGSFTLARNNFSDHYIVPQVSVDQNSITAATDIEGISYPEIKPGSKIRSVVLGGSAGSGIIYASSTRTGQILLTGYSETGEIRNQRSIGSINPYEVADLIETEDGGIAILATTFMTGRYPRPALIKLSVDEVRQLIN